MLDARATVRTCRPHAAARRRSPALWPEKRELSAKADTHRVYTVHDTVAAFVSALQRSRRFFIKLETTRETPNRCEETRS